MATFACTLIAFSDAHPDDARARAYVAKLLTTGEAALVDLAQTQLELVQKVLDLRAKRT